MDRGAHNIRVAVCDDSPVVRDLLTRWIIDADGFEPAGEAADGREAVELVRSIAPDALVLDLEMPEYDGVQAVEKIREFDDALPIIIHSGSSESAMHDAARRAGSTAFVPKTGSPDELISAIRAALAGS